MSLRSKLLDSLRSIQIENPDVEALVISTIQGLPIASALPGNVEEGVLAAMSSAIFNVSKRAVNAFNKKRFARVFIHTQDGSLVISHLGTEYLLMILFKKDVSLDAANKITIKIVEKFTEVMKS